VNATPDAGQASAIEKIELKLISLPKPVCWSFGCEEIQLGPGADSLIQAYPVNILSIKLPKCSKMFSSPICQFARPESCPIDVLPGAPAVWTLPASLWSCHEISLPWHGAHRKDPEV
jgi:hypothetical protein